MSKHNYSQYSNNKNTNSEIIDSVSFKTADAVVTPVSGMPVLELDVPVEPVIEPVIETVETVVLPATVTGVVAHCTKLNVRAKPDTDATVVCVLNAGTELEIDVSKSTNDWFNVYTATGVEGYCMRNFVNAKL